MNKMKIPPLPKPRGITKEQFRDAVTKDHLLLEVFGACLPTREAADAFLKEATVVYYETTKRR